MFKVIFLVLLCMLYVVCSSTSGTDDGVSGLHDEVASQHDEVASQHDEVASQHDEVASQHDEVVSQHDEVASQHGEVVSQHGEVASQHDEVASQHDEVASQHDEVASQHDEVASQHDEVASQHDEVASQHGEVASQHGEVASQHDEVASQHGEVASQHDEVASLHGEVASQHGEVASQHGEVVGFTAWTKMTQNYSDGDIIIFEGTTVNEGDYYLPDSGRFVCPYDAVYYVSLTDKKDADADTFLEVVRGGEIFLRIRDDYNEHNIISTSALIDCQQGQFILVRGVYSGAIYGSPGQAHSTFTVIMMWRDNSVKTSTPSAALLHNGTYVGFSSFNLGSDSYGPGEVVPFRGVILSSPDFDTELGVFTCPVTGIYYVITHFRKGSDSVLYLGVSKDANITLNSEDASTDNNYNTLSNSRLLSCQAGEVLAVTGVQAGSVYGEDNGGWTTFSAMLVYKEENLLHSSFVGFTMMKNSDQTYSAGDRIAFEVPLLNNDNVYNTTLNAFVCPDSALYYVSVTFVKVGTAALNLAVVMETGVPFYSEENYTGNPGNTVSNGGLFHCIPGQQVFVAAVGDGSIHGDTSKALTTFTIMKIFEY